MGYAYTRNIELLIVYKVTNMALKFLASTYTWLGCLDFMCNFFHHSNHDTTKSKI
jgi:hypothetical protein